MPAPQAITAAARRAASPGRGAQDEWRKIATPVPAVGSARQPLFHFRCIDQGLEQRLACEEMRLIIAVHLRVEANETHEKRRPGAGMTKDKELLAREELPDLCYFFGGDPGNGITLPFFGLAFE